MPAATPITNASEAIPSLTLAASTTETNQQASKRSWSSLTHAGAPKSAAAPVASPPTAAASAGAATPVPQLATAATSSPADQAALHAALDYYVSNPTFRCTLAYAGGSNPGGSRVLTQLQWDKRPKLFKALIVGSTSRDRERTSPEPVFFATGKVISITQI